MLIFTRERAGITKILESPQLTLLPFINLPKLKFKMEKVRSPKTLDKKYFKFVILMVCLPLWLLLAILIFMQEGKLKFRSLKLGNK